MKDFWIKWRHEIVRGAVLFGGVVAVGLLIASGFHRVSMKVNDLAHGFPAQVRNFTANMGTDFSAPGRTHGDPWNWHKKLAPGQSLTIRNISGPIDLQSGGGPEATVTTEKSWLGNDSATVRMVSVETATGVTICAVDVESHNDECGVHSWSTDNHHNHNGVAVKFTIQVPKGVNVDIGTVTGDVQITGGTGAVTAKSGMGDVTVTTMGWPVDIESGTGDVSATLGAPGQGVANVKAGTGDVSVTLPEHANLTVDAHTGTGDLSDEFGIPVVEQKYGPSKSLAGILGVGGGRLSLVSGTGDIALNKAAVINIQVSPVVAPTIRHAPRAPHAPKPAETTVHPK